MATDRGSGEDDRLTGLLESHDLNYMDIYSHSKLKSGAQTVASSDGPIAAQEFLAELEARPSQTQPCAEILLDKAGIDVTLGKRIGSLIDPRVLLEIEQQEPLKELLRLYWRTRVFIHVSNGGDPTGLEFQSDTFRQPFAQTCACMLNSMRPTADPHQTASSSAIAATSLVQGARDVISARAFLKDITHTSHLVPGVQMPKGLIDLAQLISAFVRPEVTLDTTQRTGLLKFFCELDNSLSMMRLEGDRNEISCRFFAGRLIALETFIKIATILNQKSPPDFSVGSLAELSRSSIESKMAFFRAGN